MDAPERDGARPVEVRRRPVAAAAVRVARGESYPIPGVASKHATAWNRKARGAGSGQPGSGGRRRSVPMRSGGCADSDPGSVEEVPPDGAVFSAMPGVLPNWPCTL